MSARIPDAPASEPAGNRGEEDESMIVHRSEELDRLGTS